ncbi:MAG: adenylate/guanylate cyclase domain-containing protein [Alphaproteobacteria bacterium]|nr:MAG: adenylate/guanylate cyclase domain-containing protein [Alphaproteobacteria bacterium]
MLARLSSSASERELPERVRKAIQEQADATERLIGWIQLGVVLTFATLYAVSPKTFPAGQAFQPVPWVIGAYFGFTIVRLFLAYRISLPGWFLLLSIVIDMGLLFLLIWSFHIQYMQPASFYLKSPTLLYVFIFIALRALRFEARFVFAAGIIAALGWSILVLYVITVDPNDTMITRDYVAYMTSNAVLLGAEFDKIVSILVVSLILGVGLIRGRALLVRAVTEEVAARELSRFFAPEVARRIRGSEREIAVGTGEVRDAAIVNFDMRGFTRLAETHAPDEVMGLLSEYQHLIVPVVQRHGGSIDKFLGDGIMATFGAASPSDTYAADAIVAVEEALAVAAEWTAATRAAGRPAPEVNGALAAGRVVFGAVGDETRLEYTVIGDAVNLSAKLEQYNKTLGTHALCDAPTFDLACAQGYRPRTTPRRITSAAVPGIGHPVDVIVLVP